MSLIWFVCWLVSCLTSQQHAGVSRDGSAVTTVRAATLFLVAFFWGGGGGHQKHPDFNPTDGHHYLDRADQVILIRLRTGHNRMNDRMYSKLKTGQTDGCPCDTAPMTGQHLPQDCPLHDVVRGMAVLVTAPMTGQHLPQDCPLHDVVR